MYNNILGCIYLIYANYSARYIVYFTILGEVILKLSTFIKGIHPKEFKELTQFKSIEQLPLPKEVFIPLQQHIGAPCKPLVAKGDLVKTGQMIGRSDSFVSSPVHASITGKVKAVDNFQHPLGHKVSMVHIVRSDEEEWKLLQIPENWETTDNDILNRLICDAGIVGLGGAAFPTHVKLSPPPEKPIDSFILNGCECEPFLTADHRMMLEMADEVLIGMSMLMKILEVKDGYIGVENNKPDAIEILTQRIQTLNLNFKVVPLQVKYPQGAEKMLIDAVLGRRVPTGGLPMDVGAVVNNVGTAVAVYDAIINGKPIIERVLSVTGDGIMNPKNVMARIGTPFKVITDYCDGISENASFLYMGGPMMGITQWSLDIPIIKATSGIVCRTDEIDKVEEYPCIQCGHCVSACPMFLVPSRIAKYAENKQWDNANKFGIMNCVECGSCAFECPAHIPLVQWIRIGKSKVGLMGRDKA